MASRARRSSIDALLLALKLTANAGQRQTKGRRKNDERPLDHREKRADCTQEALLVTARATPLFADQQKNEGEAFFSDLFWPTLQNVFDNPHGGGNLRNSSAA
jgi:hypothetical protein